MDGCEDEVLAYMGFPKAHRQQIHSTNPLERLNAEIKRRTDVVGIFPNDAAIVHLVGTMLLEQNDEWSLQHRYMQLEGRQSLSDDQPARLSAVIRRAPAKSTARATAVTPRPRTRDPSTPPRTIKSLFTWALQN